MTMKLTGAAAVVFLLVGCGPSEPETLEQKAEAFARSLIGVSTSRLVQELGEPTEKSEKTVTANGIEEVWSFAGAPVVRIVNGKVTEVKY